MPTQQGCTHGGARAGAWRKPKAATYAAQVSVIEQTIVDALPAIVDKVIQMAKDGDLKAAHYLIDRVLGRVTLLPAPPSMADCTPAASVDTAPSTPPARNRSQGMTSAELQDAAFGPKTFLPTLEIIRRDVDSEIQRRERRPALHGVRIWLNAPWRVRRLSKPIDFRMYGRLKGCGSNL